MARSKIKVKAIRSGRYGRYLLRWRLDGKPRERLTELPATARNKKSADRLASELENQLNADPKPGRLSWSEFRVIYFNEYLSVQSKSYRGSMRSALSSFQKHVGSPGDLEELTSRELSQFTTALIKSGHPQTTVQSYLKHVKAALGWAVENGLMAEVPKHRVKATRRQSAMRSRPITEEELERMIAAIPKVRKRKQDVGVWRDYLMGLWLSGLRLEESTILSWEWRKPFNVDLEGRYPCFRINGDSEKGRTDRVLPIAPEFVEWLRSVPKEKRRGRVFQIGCAASHAQKIVARIGEAANVVVNQKGKTATAHDLRRAFGTRWAKRLAPAELQQLMRHRSIETTMSHYVHLNVNDLGAKIWEKGGQMGGQTTFNDDPDCQRPSTNSLPDSEL